MSLHNDEELQKLVEIACAVVVEDANVFAAVLGARRRAENHKRSKIKVKQGRLIYARPTYTCSTWWTMLQKGHPQNKVFRRRFSVPFTMFKLIVSEARDWITDGGKRMGNNKTDCVGIEGVPFELKVLGALRMSAKGCSFDAIAELSGMSISTMQLFYHTFWEKFVAVFRDRWIYYPVTAADAADNLAVYARLGFPGAIGSVDCTHVRWFRCPALFQNSYSGKDKKATIAYEVTVNHSGRCLHISCGHPGARNDKTIVKTDKLVMDLKDNKILQDVEYKLFKVSTTF